MIYYKWGAEAEYGETVKKVILSCPGAYTKSLRNVDEAAELIVDFDIIAKAEIAKKAIPECNIVFKTGTEMRETAGGFLQVLYDANPQSVGGKLPDEGFYYLE